MIISVLLTAAFVAGVGHTWRMLVSDLKWLSIALERYLPQGVNHAVTCPVCFTYWATLFTVVVFNPLEGLMPAFRLPLLLPFRTPLSIIFSWFSVGCIAWTIRLLLLTLYRLEKRPSGSE
jgi:hypothetical protein